MSVNSVLRARHLTKQYGDVIANDDVSLDLRAGEVHCVLGENGAGKSTLIELLTGLQRPDTGSIEIDGEPVVLSAPAVGIAHGIGVLHQHSLLPPTMTVRDAVRLDASRGHQKWRDKWWNGWRPAARTVARSEQQGELQEFGGLNPDALIETLGPGQRRQLELSLVLARSPRILILDEPSSTLSPAEAEGLAQRIEVLRAQGAAVLLVTHQLEEALRLGNRITVLRRGRVVLEGVPVGGASSENLTGDALDKGAIIAAMFGVDEGESASVSAALKSEAPVSEASIPVAVADGAPELLRLERVSTALSGDHRALNDVSLIARSGEILGIAGIDGHGQRELAEVIAGQLKPSAGSIVCAGRDVTRGGVHERRAAGIGYVTADRLHEGIIGSLSIALNLVLKSVGEAPFWRRGRLRTQALHEEATKLIARYDIRPADPATPAGLLSGGNVQKILLARELTDDASVVVLDRPCTGLDLATVQRVHTELAAFAAKGGAVVLISPDLDELTQLAHRIVVLSAGRVAGAVQNDRATVSSVRAQVGALISGEGRA